MGLLSVAFGWIQLVFHQLSPKQRSNDAMWGLGTVVGLSDLPEANQKEWEGLVSLFLHNALRKIY